MAGGGISTTRNGKRPWCVGDICIFGVILIIYCLYLQFIFSPLSAVKVIF